MPLKTFCRYFQLTVVTLTCSAAESYAVNRALSELTEGNLFQGLSSMIDADHVVATRQLKTLLILVKQVQHDDRAKQMKKR